MSEPVRPQQHYGSMMPTAGKRRRPCEDGWRTPAIEDDEHPANLHPQRSLNTFQDHFQGLHHRRFSPPEEAVDQPCDHSHEAMMDNGPKSLPWKMRIKHVTWAWFTLTMATGGIANVLHVGK